MTSRLSAVQYDSMRDWSLTPGDPLCLVLAADSRFSACDYLDDQSWELEFGGAEPAALALHTTYGLRAKAMRIFYRFCEGNKTVSDPAAFVQPPAVRRFYPNFLVIEYAPLPTIDVTAEYWVPQSNAAAGRITLVNRSNKDRTIALELCAVLSALEGQGMAAAQIQMVNVLAGRSRGLSPILFMTGGPTHGARPQPSLLLNLELSPGATRQFSWAHAATDDAQTSFALARQTAARPWDAERARIELTNASQTIDVSTPEPDWNAAFALSQSAAFRLLFPPNDHLPNPSIVSSRGPDSGYSLKGDGSDYPAAWSGQTPFDAYYLQEALPASPAALSLLKNFIAVQKEDGAIDDKPGFAGQRGRCLAAPLLASLAWKLYTSSGDEDFLKQAFPALQKFFWAWFSPKRDKDRDGVPQWKHILQTGFEENPLFDSWHPWSLGGDISQVHSPELEALLYNEAECLMRIAEALGKRDMLTLFREQAAKLRASIEAAWQERASLYHYRERETGSSLEGKTLATVSGSGVTVVKLNLEGQFRLQIEVRTQSPKAKRPRIRLYQWASKAADETIESGDYQWSGEGATYTTQKIYSKLAKISVRGLDDEDTAIIRTLDYAMEDHTLFMPLWAGAPDAARAQRIVERALLDESRFDRPFGVPACPSLKQPAAEIVAQAVHLMWNLFICEGLLRYGFRKEAARLFERNMSAVIQNLKMNRAFYARYHAERGAGIGERNVLSGLAPTGLFLKILGVEILSSTRVRLTGENPFPWDVTLRFKRLTVIRTRARTEAIFANGASTIVENGASAVVEA